MPAPTRWLIRAALLWLVAALALGVAMQLPLAARTPFLQAAWPTYLHLLVVGWLTQLIFGVALWLFPRYSAASTGSADWLGWATFMLLNVGLMLRVLGEPRRALGGEAQVILALSAVSQLLAVLAFVRSAWPRVRER